MTTIADLRDLLRIELHDETDDRWQDDVLDRHLQRAARELAFVWPRERKSTLSTTDGSRDLDVSSLSSLVRILAVEYPTGHYPPCYVQFSLFAATLSLLTDTLPGASESVNVYWGSLHTLDGSTSTLAAVAEDATITGASAYAAIEWASFATNRGNVGGTGVVDDYLRWGERQLTKFQGTLARFGDSGRVRASNLYTPFDAVASQDVVRWEP